ncbi:DUF1801 domain-containing protein [Candidatus Saccharibacteria bacterium]|nr:DUF1801 domain-containing protein [Candidatus Saccharibacteria bacterium]MCB9835064.1 DUF1801 domain-containing protein [Candidatus Nomurabacteria bacterium]
MTVDQYLANFNGEVYARLQAVRKLIRTEVPEATESIAYGMPAYKFSGKPLVYFAGYAQHLGLYATPSSHQAFAKQLSKYKQGKGSVQFPLDQPLPLDLIREIIRYKAQQISNDRL